jgi:hypothetical protein
MGRLARVVAVDVPHHLTQRGNDRRFILDCAADRATYLSLLRENMELYRVSVMGYCLNRRVHTSLPIAAILRGYAVPRSTLTTCVNASDTTVTYCTGASALTASIPFHQIPYYFSRSAYLDLPPGTPGLGGTHAGCAATGQNRSCAYSAGEAPSCVRSHPPAPR